MPLLTLRGGLMACPASTNDCRAAHIAPKLRDAEQDGTDWEARCPLCGHGGFRVSVARVKRYRHVWTCACKRCRCDERDPAGLRAALLGLGITSRCLGIYGGNQRAGNDPIAAARIEQAVRDILTVPHLRPSDIRITLAEALGEKVPTDARNFVPWAMGIGIGRRQAFEAAQRWCRPADQSPPPGDGVVDT